MPIEITTVYDKQRLIRFNNYVAASRKWFWIFLGICTAIVAFACVIAPEVWHYALILLGMDLLCVLFYFVIPRFTIKRSVAFNATVQYVFDAEQILIQSESKHAKESSETRYTVIKRVGKHGSDLYLFISSMQAYVVDLSTLTEQQIADLRAVLYQHVKPSKIKWKD